MGVWRHIRMVKSDICFMVWRWSALTQHDLFLQENEADMLNLSPAAVLYSEVKHHKLQLLLNSHHITRETDDFKYLKMFYCKEVQKLLSLCLPFVRAQCPHREITHQTFVSFSATRRKNESSAKCRPLEHLQIQTLNCDVTYAAEWTFVGYMTCWIRRSPTCSDESKSLKRATL